MASYITLDEAAARSGISRATLLNWIKRRRFLTAHKSLSEGDWSGEKWWILETELEKLIGRRLAPRASDIGDELDGVEALISSAVAALESDASASPETLKDLQFAAQALSDLNARINLQERLP
jgi:hypothetical protein